MKIKLDPEYYLLPMPTTLVGANVDGKPNFQTAAFVGYMSFTPHIIAISIAKNHHTTKGVEKNGTFSINLPSDDLVVRTDYCGITSGSKVDKSQVFSVFYGDLETAPMIEECPLTMECKVVHKKDFGITIISFFGEVVKIYANDEILTDGAPNLVKLRPLLLVGQRGYYKLGERVADAYKIGREY